MIQATDSRATATLSGRELALKRRQAMALHGKTGTTKAVAGRKLPVQAARPATAEADLSPAASLAAASAGRSASRARREALSSAGKAALMPAAARPTERVRPQAAPDTAMAATDAPKSCGCGCNGTKKSCNTLLETQSTSAETVLVADVVARPAGAPAGRALARARRSILSQDGNAGLKRVAQAAKMAASMPMQDWEAAISKGATGRQTAMQRRLMQSLTGGKEESARPAGRVRTRMTVPSPVKVEGDQVLSVRPVTGILVDRGKKVTGNEPGASRVITGTEHIGPEQLTAVYSTMPAPTPGRISVREPNREHTVTGTSINRSGKVTGDEPGSARTITGTGCVLPSDGGAVLEKVVVTHTSQGKVVTGTGIGLTGKTTGDEHGACRVVTGTEYMSTEAFKACNIAVPQGPRKVSVMSSRDKQTISGSDVGRSAKVTGDEPGSCRNITGSQYYVTDDALCSATGPRKVSVMHTLSGRTLTGSELGRTAKMTGDEMGSCKPVTGTEYIGADQQAAVCGTTTPVAPVEKVAVDQTWRGQPVTGSYVGRSNKVTGDEQGGCAPISGTPYIGREQYKRFCETPAVREQEARIPSSAMISATAVTGDRPGGGGSVMTGDERGACEIVSGTPYMGVDNTSTRCATSSRFVERASAWVEPAQPPAPADFSITTPARAAQKKEYGGVTGAGYSSERITGPINKAAGLITGTPEFRHRDAVDTIAEQKEVASAAHRLTGEGSQAGRSITGDAWNAMSRVTGTEGTSSQVRNPSERGNPRGMGMNATLFREKVERTPAPESRITGSAGSTGSGALVTLSGGARG